MTDAIARLHLIVRYDIASSCTALGLRCAARIASVATTHDEWRDVASDLRALVTDGGRDHERIAARDAAAQMASGCTSFAASAMRCLRDETMTVADYLAEVTAEAREAGVSL